MSVYGNSLVQARTGIDIDQRVSVLIGKLLTPLTLDKLLSQDHNLPFYAEAAPEEFLRVVEADLDEGRTGPICSSQTCRQ